MKDLFETSSLLRQVYSNRLTGPDSTEIVCSSTLDRYEFGQKLFRKILQKTILKPGSIQREERPAVESPF